MSIFESKGSFPNTNIDGDVSTDLNNGLQQISTWPSILSIPKSYACASYIRENNDPHSEGSITCFVDPEGEGENQVIEFPTSRLLRENYAAWFVAMGLPSVGANLRSYETNNVAKHRFVIYSYDSNDREKTKIAFPLDNSDEHRIRSALGGLFVLDRFGIQLEVLRAIPALMQDEVQPILLERTNADSNSLSGANGGSYSLFPDGSFLGAIPSYMLENPEFVELNL